MKKLLVINSSARISNSHSRKLTEVFVEHWKNTYSEPIINFRELGTEHVPHITENWIAAAFRPESARSEEHIEALKISDEYIAELREADSIVIGAPMYNWSVPSSLKAYIDQILRVNETWKLNPDNPQNPYIGLMENKTLYLLLSRGNQGYEKGGYNEHMNFQSNYLKTVFNVIGIHDIHMVTVGGESFDLEKFRQAVNESHQNVRDLIAMQTV